MFANFSYADVPHTKMFRIIFYISLYHIVNGNLWNHPNAQEQCEGYGGFVSYQDLKSDDGTTYGQLLHEGQSAWISDYVKFYKFVSWHGCYTDPGVVVYKNELQNNNIYHCLKKCSFNTSLVYIGLRRHSCYCVDWYSLQQFKPEPNNMCQPQSLEPDFAYKKEADNLNIVNMYAVIGKTTLRWNRGQPDIYGQCVVEVKMENDTTYDTQSCFANSKGFICANSIYKKMENCNNDSQQFCIVPKSSTWLQSENQCKKLFSGKLISHVDPKTKSFLSPNDIYWTGIFRSYNLVNESQPVCLAVTKVENKLVFHPENCSVQKTYICYDNLTNVKSNTTRFGKVEIPTTSVSITSIFDLGKTNAQAKERPDVTYNPTGFEKVASSTHIVNLFSVNRVFDTENSTNVQTEEHTHIKSNPTVFRKVEMKTVKLDSIKPIFDIEKPTTVQTNERTNENEDLIGMYLAIGSGFFAAVLLVVFVIWLIRRKKNKSRREQRSNVVDGNVKEDANATTDTKYTAIVEAKAIDTTQTPTQHGKPKTARESSLMTETKSYPNKWDYDTVELISSGKRCMQNPMELQIESSDIHVYGHHTDFDDASGDYDHLGPNKSKQLTKPPAGVYSTMADVNNTYNELVTGASNKSVDLSNTRKEQKNTDNTVYDKLCNL